MLLVSKAVHKKAGSKRNQNVQLRNKIRVTNRHFIGQQLGKK